ncbi:hypothetical protein [Thermogymnomonas acidicola]|uniref:hypothetical protein n=1 Tax=Thermogymnomonas acidicola TaxID=399579 RepID=UPI00094648EC|nr:hypothetical protein [Thermogymnomonas acidicola]
MRAISLGKRVRTETGISSGKSSVFDIAADVVASELGSTGLPVLVIGSGRAASSVYNVLMSLGFTDVTACSAGQVASLRRSFSAAVAALRPDEGKIDPSSMEALRASKVIVDISNPAAVVDDGMGRCRYMPDLAQHALEMRASKARDVARAEAMVEEAVQRFMVELNRYQVDEVISSMFRYAEEVRRSEVSRFLKEVSGGSSIDSAWSP